MKNVSYILIIIGIFSKNILLIFGQGYDVASSTLVILMAAIACGAMFGVNFIYLNMTGRQKIFQYILMITVVFNFFLNKYLVPRYGLIGAAIAFLISTLIWNIISALYIYKKDNVKVFIH